MLICFHSNATAIVKLTVIRSASFPSFLALNRRNLLRNQHRQEKRESIGPRRKMRGRKATGPVKGDQGRGPESEGIGQGLGNEDIGMKENTENIGKGAMKTETIGIGGAGGVDQGRRNGNGSVHDHRIRRQPEQQRIHPVRRVFKFRNPTSTYTELTLRVTETI